jgi:hypothetical protein
MIAIPRGKYLGKASERSAEGEAEHFIRCLAYGGWMDCRNLAQVFDPKGPLPHPAQIDRNDRGPVETQLSRPKGPRPRDVRLAHEGEQARRACRLPRQPAVFGVSRPEPYGWRWAPEQPNSVKSPSMSPTTIALEERVADARKASGRSRTASASFSLRFQRAA